MERLRKQKAADEARKAELMRQVRMTKHDEYADDDVMNSCVRYAGWMVDGWMDAQALRIYR